MICDKKYRLGFTKEAEETVAKMTLEEKVFLMAGKCRWLDSMGIGDYNSVPYAAGGCERLGVPEMRFCDGPRGCVSGTSTCFPVTAARGATFDPELEERVGKAIGEEIRANGGNFFGGVCLNVPYNPGGGRSQETYGEDSMHIGKMGSALVKGIQSENVIACIKHFAFNSMENSRFWINITADKRTEREVYLPHFKRCIDAGAAAVMSSYNRYRGVFNGANKYLLGDVLRDEWGFDGFVVSDFMMGLHSTAGGVNAGLDIEMNIRRKYTYRKIKRALKKGRITEKQIDEIAVRIVRTLLSFNSADNDTYDEKLIASDEHIALAREAAEKSVTLIKNDNKLLPLDRSKIKRIAVVGDLAKIENIGDNGSSQVHPPYVKTVLQGIRESAGNIAVDFIPTRRVAADSALIKAADAVIAVCGLRHGDEGEYIVVIGGDRSNLGLRASEVKMLKKLGTLNRNTAAVVMGGGALRISEWSADINAILMAYYPGMEGGTAVANIIFGDVNPGGKLPFVMAKKDSDFPQVKWRALNQHYGYYHGYQKLDKDNTKPDYPYGFGLSYTDFELSNIALKEESETEAVFSATVKNVGGRAGAEVVQLYAGWKNSAVDRPLKALQDFKRVELQPGEEKEVLLTVEKSDLAYYDETKGFVSEDIIYTAFIGTDEQSCSDNKIEFTFGKAKK